MSQKLNVPKAECLGSWMSQKLNVSKAGCPKSWMSQKLNVQKAECPIKLNVRKAERPVAECPKAECPRAECLSVIERVQFKTKCTHNANSTECFHLRWNCSYIGDSWPLPLRGCLPLPCAAVRCRFKMSFRWIWNNTNFFGISFRFLHFRYLFLFSGVFSYRLYLKTYFNHFTPSDRKWFCKRNAGKPLPEFIWLHSNSHYTMWPVLQKNFKLRIKQNFHLGLHFQIQSVQ